MEPPHRIQAGTFPPDLAGDEVVVDAEGSIGKTPEERWAIFCGLQRLLGSIWDNLDEEEIRRRLEIGEKLEPRPDPWWRDVLPEGLE